MSFTPGAGTRFLLSTNSSGALSPSGPLSIAGGTATANAPVLNATQTWNNAAVTFTGWQLNVTDTASNAASLLMDLQRGGVTQFRVRKDGQLAFNGDLVINPNDINLRATASNGVLINSTGFSIGEQSAIFFRDVPAGTIYSALRTQVSGVIEQRNGVNAQTLRVYNTFTDASNYERGRFAWVSNVLTIGTENAGTGLARNLTIESAGGGISFSSSVSIQLQVNGRAFISHAAGASTLNFGGVTAGPANIDTIAIFTNNAQRWTFNNSGHFVAFTDNAYDIGSIASNRPRSIYLSANVQAGSGGEIYWANRSSLTSPSNGILRLSDNAGAGGSFELQEMTAPAAPATNFVRIYAEDNGSGKTRLMALFATGAAQQIAIEP